MNDAYVVIVSSNGLQKPDGRLLLSAYLLPTCHVFTRDEQRLTSVPLNLVQQLPKPRSHVAFHGIVTHGVSATKLWEQDKAAALREDEHLGGYARALQSLRSDVEAPKLGAEASHASHITHHTLRATW